MQNNHYCKDLRMVDRSLSQCVLVDTVPYAYTLQIDNGVPLLPYTSGDDKTLLELEKYLQMLTECSDVRVVNKEVFKLSSYCKFVSPKQLVTTLYRDYLI